MPNKPIFPTPQDAEAAFYEALERADLEAMMSVWAEDEEIVCIHPGGPRLIGYASIREAWRRMFDGGARLQVRLSQPTMTLVFFYTVATLFGWPYLIVAVLGLLESWLGLRRRLAPQGAQIDG